MLLSAGFGSLFIRHGLGWFDEAWPLYAAKRLHEGGTLYRDVFFLFPPGHLLPAWIAYGVAPPGIILARAMYAGFDVALVLSLYLLGRRLMPPTFALLGAALLAVAAPESHLVHLLFGYRYLVFSVLGLLALSRRIATSDLRWMLLCGVCGGLALLFRITPAFALSCAIAVAVPSLSHSWRRWLIDWGSYAIGLLAVALPVLAVFASEVGVDVVWREIVIRVVGLQSEQSLPAPALAFPAAWDRESLYEFFVALQFRVYPLLLTVYALFLAGRWVVCLKRREPFPHPLLLATVVWGGVYLFRAVGRSDDHHLYSALPPLCLLMAHAVRSVGAVVVQRAAISSALEARSKFILCIAVFAAWTFLMRSDEYLDPVRRGAFAVITGADEVFVGSQTDVLELVHWVEEILRWSGPDDTILNLSLTPIFYLLSTRSGPGYFDILMPGTFLDESEEIAFVERLRTSPPAVVVYPMQAMDQEGSRSISDTAPHLARWVNERYRILGPTEKQGFVMMVPAERDQPPSFRNGT